MKKQNKSTNRTLKEGLKDRNFFWIIKPKTLAPNGLSQELH